MAQNNAMLKKGRCLNFGNCNKANTKEIVEINVGEDFVCPDCQGDLVEVKVSKPPYGLIAGGVVAVLAIAVGAYFFLMKGDTIPTEPVTDSEITMIDSVKTEECMNNTDKEEIIEPAPEVEPVKSSEADKQPTTGGIVTKDLGYAVWTGKMKNGKPHDVQGILKFKTNHIIDSRDDKERMAGPGDKVIGTFEEGHLTQGKWYKTDGNVESIILGGL